MRTEPRRPDLPPRVIPGLILHWATGYDLMAWVITLGREPVMREKMLSLARLAPGESVLDIGCGTGTLAIAAKRHVGAAGSVAGLDASPEMISRAGAKARRAGLDVAFQVGSAQALPFPDAQFDVVLSTLMLHHLPGAQRRHCAREIKRVLKPGGRVLAIDFAAPASRHGIIGRWHRHGHVRLGDIIAILGDAGIRIVESGAVGFRDLGFVLGTAPSPI